MFNFFRKKKNANTYEYKIVETLLNKDLKWEYNNHAVFEVKIGDIIFNLDKRWNHRCVDCYHEYVLLSIHHPIYTIKIRSDRHDECKEILFKLYEKAFNNVIIEKQKLTNQRLDEVLKIIERY